MLNRPHLVWLLVAVQTLCGAYFLWEIVASIFGLPTLPLRWETKELVQIGASLGLILGAFLGVVLAREATRARARAETAHRLTSGQFTDVVAQEFTRYDLSPAETEVAWLLLKGMSIGEIAELRQTQLGTVKAQCSSIYRKSGATGKSQFVSQIVEDLLL